MELLVGNTNVPDNEVGEECGIGAKTRQKEATIAGLFLRFCGGADSSPPILHGDGA